MAPDCIACDHALAAIFRVVQNAAKLGRNLLVQ
jgi:hypothetical protein